MDQKTTQAVQQLNDILPLKHNQKNLAEPLRQLHREILLSYFSQGKPPAGLSLQQNKALPDNAFEQLAEQALIVIDAAGEITGAYPFTSEQREHSVLSNGQKSHCMCALDALAVSPMFNQATEVNSVCHVNGNAIHIEQDRMMILNANTNKDVYFGIEWSAACSSSCCADSLCGEMLFLKGDDVATQWQKENPASRQCFKLDEAVEFAAAFFVPLMSD